MPQEQGKPTHHAATGVRKGVQDVRRQVDIWAAELAMMFLDDRYFEGGVEPFEGYLYRVHFESGQEPRLMCANKNAISNDWNAPWAINGSMDESKIALFCAHVGAGLFAGVEALLSVEAQQKADVIRDAYKSAAKEYDRWRKERAKDAG